ncbi:MAG: hypothetical protein FWC91_14630, partial [Defluviitaleaceae bacterium]|nr:hypothetical protein [Defluviitaleaceae bacterium]
MKRYFKRIGAAFLSGAVSLAAFAPVNASAEFEYYGEFGFEHPITTTTPGALIPGNNDDGLIREI